MRGIARTALFVVLGAVALGCSTITDSRPLDLEGTTWVATRVAGELPVPASAPSLTFDGEQIAGNTGCNTFTGKVVIDGASIAVDGLANTDIACSEPIASIEKLFVNALGRASSIRYDGNNLVIGGDAGEIVLMQAVEPGGIPVGS